MAKRGRVNSLQAAWEAHRLGDLKRAESLYRQIIRLNSRENEALRLLANVLRRTGRVPEAIGQLKKSLAIRRDNFDALTELGKCHKATGNLREAIAAFRRAAELKPEKAEAHLRLAEAYALDLNYRDAARVLENGLASIPGELRMMRALADTCVSIGRYGEAVELYEKILRDSPGALKDAALQEALGTALRMAGRFEEALQAFDTAISIQPMLPGAIAGRAEILESTGQSDDAVSQLEPVLRKGRHPHPDVVLTYGRLASRAGHESDAIAYILKTLKNPSVDASKRLMLQFLLGSLYEKQGRYDESFDAYCEANKPWANRFDEASYIEGINRLIEVFDEDSLDQLPRAKVSVANPQPVYIVGMMRSGTSLIEQMLSCHSMVGAGGELDYIPAAVGELSRDFGPDHPYPLALRMIDDAKMTMQAEEVHSSMSEIDPEAMVVTDKLPNNYLHLGFISLLFPGVRVIHGRRNPLDTCFSCFATRLGPQHIFANNLQHAAIAYRQYRRLMDHWREVLGIEILDVDYERVVDDPEVEIRRVLEFLDLPWEGACLRFHESDRVTRTASQDQVRQPIYQTSRYRYKRFEKHLGALRDALAEFLD